MLTKLVKQSVGISEIGKVEALSEPAIDGRKQIASTFKLSIITPETGQSCGSAQLPPASLLPACHHECSLELNFRFAGFSHHDHQFTPEPMQLGLVVSLTGLFQRLQGIVQQGKTDIGLPEFGVCSGE